MKIGNREFDRNKTYIMGILNVTPDSFSDGGSFDSVDKALKHTEKMIKEGAEIIDIGGESTRPDYTMISDDEEISRIIPVIEGIKNNFDIPLSVDTYKSSVAEAALKSGANLINDIWGLKYDGKMAKIIKEYDVPCCLAHNRRNPVYTDFLREVVSDFKEITAAAQSCGIDGSKIIFDPGIGFAKSYEQNLELINNLDIFTVHGIPILIGASRKSVIGTALDLPPSERLEGTIATTVIAVMKGCNFIRVHDVKENKRAVIMTEKIIGR